MIYYYRNIDNVVVTPRYTAGGSIAPIYNDLYNMIIHEMLDMFGTPINNQLMNYKPKWSVSYYSQDNMLTIYLNHRFIDFTGTHILVKSYKNAIIQYSEYTTLRDLVSNAYVSS